VALWPGRVAFQSPRPAEPLVIGVVGEYVLPILERVDQPMRYGGAHGGATPTATNATLLVGRFGVDIGRAMNHQGRVGGAIVDARLQAVHAQRVAVVPVIGVERTEQTLARFEA